MISFESILTGNITWTEQDGRTYLGLYVYVTAISEKKEAISLKESKKGYGRVRREEKEEENDILIN